MQVKLTFYGKEMLAAKLEKRLAEAPQALEDAMKHEMTKLADYARLTKFDGSPLNRRTGRLSRSIKGDAWTDGSSITGEIGVNVGEVPYAPVHEFGGTFVIPEHARRVGYQAIKQSTQLVRTRLLTKTGAVRAAVKAMSRGVVRTHTATYPQRAFIHPSLEERHDAIMASMREQLMEFLNAS